MYLAGVERARSLQHVRPARGPRSQRVVRHLGLSCGERRRRGERRQSARPLSPDRLAQGAIRRPGSTPRSTCSRNPDVAAAGVDPLEHFLQSGYAEGRQAYAAVGPSIVGGFDAQHYLFHNPDVAAAGVDALAHYNTFGWHEGRNPNGWFDTAGYLAHYGDVAAAGANPLAALHAVRLDTRDAIHRPRFDTLGYLAANPDVAAGGANPLEHYLLFGIYEGRAGGERRTVALSRGGVRMPAPSRCATALSDALAAPRVVRYQPPDLRKELPVSNDKQNKLKARMPRGLADRGPAEIAATRRMLEVIRGVFERYGFDPVETPMIEYTDALGKFLPDQDRPNEGVFSFQDDDEQWLSLRYDLTAPLARYVAENFDALPKPYRSYRFGYVYRNEKPGPGRFRQFMQFDADTVGSASMAADAEVCMMIADTMEQLGIPRGSYVVKVNNRKVLDGVMEAIGSWRGESGSG